MSDEVKVVVMMLVVVVMAMMVLVVVVVVRDNYVNTNTKNLQTTTITKNNP